MNNFSIWGRAQFFIIKWLKDSGLKVNESKTEICLFHRLDQNPITIKVSGSEIKSKLKKLMDIAPLVIAGKKLVQLKEQLEFEHNTNNNLFCLSLCFESHIPENVVDQMNDVLVQDKHFLDNTSL